MPQHTRQTTWNDAEMTQPIPVVRPARIRASWTPVPADQPLERRRAIWTRVVVVAAGFSLFMTVIGLIGVGLDGVGSSSSATSASSANSVLGCPLLTAGLADSGCTSRQAIVRACDVPLIDVSWQVTSGSLDTGSSVVWFGPASGEQMFAVVNSETGDPDYGAAIKCPGSSTGWPLPPGTWTTLKLPGDPFVLPTWLR